MEILIHFLQLIDKKEDEKSGSIFSVMGVMVS
jgi:hypothetical protein